VSAGAVSLVLSVVQASQRTPKIRIPGYVIETEIGRGGVATVYLATQQSLDRKVALKVMSPALAAEPDFTDRFEREGRTVARFSHPNIVTIYDVGVADYQHYIAMEYLSGGSLKRSLHQPLDIEFALTIVQEMAEALGYAHGQGYVHRDVKPENILFRNDGVAVLTDFGIAKSSDSHTQLTRSGTIVGTPRYMSPEQAQGEPATARSDIYALGVILYEMLTARPPFDTPESLAVLYSHINDPVPELPARCADLQSLVDAMMTKDPEDRVPDCETLGDIVKMVQVDRANPASTRRSPRVPVRSAEQRRRDRASLVATQGNVDADAITEEIKIPPPAARRARQGISGAIIGSAAWYFFSDDSGLPAPAAPQVVEQPTEAEETTPEVSPVTAGSDGDVQNPATTDAQSVVDESASESADAAITATSTAAVTRTVTTDTDTVDGTVPDSTADAVQPDDAELPQAGVEKTVADSDAVDAEVVQAEPENPVDSAETQSSPEISPNLVIAESGSAPPAEVVSPEASSVVTTESPSDVAAPTAAEQVASVTPAPDPATPPAPTAKVETPTPRPVVVDVAEVERRLANAAEFVDRDRLSHPPGDNAMEIYRGVLELDPGNADALSGLARIAAIYNQRALDKFDAGDMAGASLDVERGRKALPDDPTLQTLAVRIKATVEANAAFTEAENYFYGVNVDVDHARAFERYSAAAYANGRGIVRDERQALFWLKQAAEKGHLEAQYLLGLGLLFGDQPEVENAGYWMQQAVDGGYERAYRVLGWMHQTGTGVSQSPTDAIKWGFKGVVGSLRTADEPRNSVLDWEARFKVAYDAAVSSSESATGPSGEETDSSK